MSNSLLSPFKKERREQFALGKEQIAISFFCSEKNEQCARKTKEQIPNPDFLLFPMHLVDESHHVGVRPARLVEVIGLLQHLRQLLTPDIPGQNIMYILR